MTIYKSRWHIEDYRKILKTGYQVNVHRTLSNWVHNKNLSSADKTDIEQAISDIQLLGSKKTIIELNDFLEDYIKNQGGDINKLLSTFVSEFREELKMEQIDLKRQFLRFPN